MIVDFVEIMPIDIDILFDTSGVGDGVVDFEVEETTTVAKWPFYFFSYLTLKVNGLLVIRWLMRGMATLLPGNQELLV